MVGYIHQNNSLIVFILLDYSILILISTGEKAGVKTYQDLVKNTIGKFGTYFLIVAQFLYPFIGLYLIHSFFLIKLIHIVSNLRPYFL